MEESELSEVEFKSAKGGFPGSFWETYSSFANSQGGVIVLGIAEKDGRYIMDGLMHNDVVKFKKAFWDNVNNKQQVSVNILNDSDVKEGEHKGNYILAINVPRADRRQMPVYLKNNPDNTYKRYNEGDYRCAPVEVRRMFADADIEHPRDSAILPDFSIEADIDVDSLNQYRRLVSAIKPSHAWLLLDNKSFLTKLGGYRVDRREKKEGLTLAGMLMFGKLNSITDVYCCPSYFPDYREYIDADPKSRWTDRIYPDGTWEANLFQFYIRVFQKLSLALPKPFSLKNGVRVEETTTHIALREAFINTLVHADYMVDANITIELRRDKYIFSNPGSLLISIPQYWRGGDSVCRNKSLHQMFMYLGTAEKAGSGVDKIIQGWKEANLRRPQLEEKKKPEKVILELPLISLLSDEVIDHLKKNFGEGVFSLEHNKFLTLATCCTEGGITNNRLQFVIEKHSSDITKLLKELCNDGYLTAEGVGRGTKYKLSIDITDNDPVVNDTSNLASNPTSNLASKVSNPTRKTKNLASNTRNLARKTNDLAGKTSDLASNFAENLTGSTNNLASNANDHASNVNELTSNTVDLASNFAENLASNTSNLASNRTDLASNFVENLASNTENLASNRNNLASNTENLASNTDDLASKASNRNIKRTPFAERKLQKQILDVSVDYISIAEIAAKVNRNMYYLKDDIIPQLLQNGLLEREFPNTPRHRKQRYRKIR